jgi:hypothetical protein
VVRADLVLIGLDQRVERRRIDQPLLDQQRLESLDAERHLRGRLGMAVAMVVMVSAHDATPLAAEQSAAARSMSPCI